MKLVTIIPAHLASIRLPRKILMPIQGIPMIEHVRRRAKLSKKINKIFVATGDLKIKNCVESFGGEVLITKKKHMNGTSRASEAVKNIDCTHVLLLQGDEPLILPRHIDFFLKQISNDNLNDAWNSTANLKSKRELDISSFVKCAVNQNDQIIYLFRKSPAYSNFNYQKKYIKKILGIICFKKNVLINLMNKKKSKIALYQSIEQMRLIENSYKVKSILLDKPLPSINVPGDLKKVLTELKNNKEQHNTLNKILKI